MGQLRITEIFYSLQGETRTVGKPTVFVRLTGCPLRCQYCDTAYAFSGGTMRSITDIVNEVAAYRPRYITLTGGEPLAQPDCLPLLSQLCDLDAEVSLETSGAMDVSAVDQRVNIVLDIKTPGSGESGRNVFANLDCLKPSDQIKFVICDRSDYEWARDIIHDMQLFERCELLFSPSHEQLDATQLADWILTDQLPVRLQIQLHKYLWGDVPGK